MSNLVSIPEFAERCYHWAEHTCEAEITGAEFAGESSPVGAIVPCACCKQSAYAAGNNRRLVSQEVFIGDTRLCESCATEVRESASKPRPGENAFYGSSGAFSIPSHNPELRKYVAAVDAGKIDLGWNTRATGRKAIKRTPSKKTFDGAPVGGMHPRLRAYLKGVETGAIAAPFKASIDYAAGGEHADICRCGECSQMLRKPTAAQIEISDAVQRGLAESYRRTAERNRANELQAAQAVAKCVEYYRETSAA